MSELVAVLTVALLAFVGGALGGAWGVVVALWVPLGCALGWATWIVVWDWLRRGRA